MAMGELLHWFQTIIYVLITKDKQEEPWETVSSALKQQMDVRLLKVQMGGGVSEKVQDRQDGGQTKSSLTLLRPDFAVFPQGPGWALLARGWDASATPGSLNSEKPVQNREGRGLSSPVTTHGHSRPSPVHLAKPEREGGL